MKAFTSVFCYMGEQQAIFQYKEYSYAKHAHFQDKQRNRISVIF